jgi:putative endonuclease
MSDQAVKGQTNYLAGLAAEQAVAARYLRAGHRLAGHRWRGAAGEIDLIFERDGTCIFVEVKKSKGFARAAESLGPRQMQRLFDAAEEFLSTQPNGSLTPARFDVALVDQTGDIQLLENALCA